jgi:hypothetical protein
VERANNGVQALHRRETQDEVGSLLNRQRHVGRYIDTGDRIK